MSRSNPTTSELTQPSLREERTRRRGARVEAKAEPHPSRLPSGHPYRTEILAAHAAALAADEFGYLDPETGLFVLTANFLARRGTCCGRGCRHCPYVDGTPDDDVQRD